MAQETLNIVITADNKNALSNINQTIKSADNLAESLKKMPNAANQANQALVNSGRVLQDLNYGFVGVANNLNPLLESFQRLSEKSKDAGSSITKELGSALIGPAGIGFALSTATFLLLKFGDEISTFIDEKTSGLGKSLQLENKAFLSAGDAYVKATTDINSLKQADSDYKNGLITKDLFLKKFNDTLKDTIAKTTDLATAEKFLSDNAENYVKMTLYKAIAQEAAAQAAKKQVEKLALQEVPLAPTLAEKALAFVSPGGTTGEDIAKKRRKAQIDDLANDAYILESIGEKYRLMASNIQSIFAGLYGKADIPPPPAPKEKILTPEEITISIKKRSILSGEDVEVVKDNIDDLIKYEQKKQKENEDYTSAGYKRRQKQNTKEFDEHKKELKEQQKDYEKFANSIANNVTGALMGMWDAMQRGENILQALGNMLGQILQKLIATIAQAAIFAGIMSLISGGGVGKGFVDFFGKALGFADGGIITKPTYGLIGEGGQNEAIMPLNKLGNMMNNTFQAGAMSGSGGGGGATVTLRGQDLLIALNRTQKASNLKGQSISLG